LGWPMEELFRLPGGRAGRVDARWVGVGDALGRRVQLVRVGGRLMAYAVGQGQLAGRVAGVVEAGQGAEVSVALLPESPPPADLAVVGCDPAFGIVVDALRRERGIEVAW